MIKIRFLTILVLFSFLCGLAVAGPYVKKTIQFVDENGNERTDLSYVYVYNAGTPTASTIYQDGRKATTITNPITTSSTNTTLLQYNGSVWFFDDNLTHDIIVHVGGRELKFTDLGRSDNTILVPRIVRNGAQRIKGSYDRFMTHPICVAKVGAGAATGTAGDENLMYTGSNIFEYHIIGTATIVGPSRIATGLSIGLDVADDDGIEICPGILAGNQSAFVVGTDGPFHFKLRFNIADVSGSDNVMVGFRKAEAYQAVALDNYDEMAAFDVVSGDIKTATIINAATTVSTDTTDDWADAATKTLEVYVDLDGAVTYKIDGAAPTTTVAYSFDAGEVVVPFFFNRYATTTPGVIYLIEWDCGLDD